MSEKDKNQKDNSFDLMQDTQYLLFDLEETAGGSYSVDDILAEFGGKEDRQVTEEKKTSEQQKKTPQEKVPPATEKMVREESTSAEKVLARSKIIAFPGVPEMPEPVEEDAKSAEKISEKPLAEDFSTDKLFALNPESAQKTQKIVNSVDDSEAMDLPAVQEKQRDESAGADQISMEDIFASTVDAVKAEHERRQDRQRKRIEKERKKQVAKRREPRTAVPLPETAEEPAPKELAAFHKRRYLKCRQRMFFAVPLLLLLWLPWFLAEGGTYVPYFSDGADNAAVCVLIPQMLLSVICGPLFIAALEELKDRCCTFYTYTALVNVAALLDEITLLALPGRSAVSPMGGVAGCALVFALWGLKNYHRGMWETFRTAAMGKPSSVVDCSEFGITKGVGSSEGFITRANMESTASQWQRLFLPLLIAASVVFALLSTVGQQRGHDFFWCWSVILCASCSLVCPLSYCVPFGRVVRKLTRNGAAVAGQYGAAALSASQQLVVTDTDLFPRTCVSLNGLKLYGEERDHAISYTATLAVQGGGCLARVFEAVCQGEHIAYQPLEHFHIHDDNGLSGMIRGETVLVGTPVFMRHKGVRLPATMPSKTAVCLAVDGELVALFAIKYDAHPLVDAAMRALGRNGISLVLATRDGNVTPKLLKNRFGTDGKAVYPESTDRLSLSDPLRESGVPNGILYREGFHPYAELVSLSRRLCQIVRVGNLLSVFGCIFGSLLAFYLTFVGTTSVLTPIMLLTFLLLWVVPMLPLLLSVDRM